MKTQQSCIEKFITRLLAATTFALASFLPTVSAEGEPPLARAAAAFEQGDLAAAESLLAPLAEAGQNDPGALGLLAQVRLRQQRPGDAATLLERALAVDGGNARLHAALGQALSLQLPNASLEEQPSLAMRMLQAFQTAVGIDPDLIEARVGLARYYTQAPEIAGGSRTRAEEQARFILQRVPWLGEAELGQIALHFDEPARARDHLARADALRPGQAWLVELRGHAAARLGDFAEARTHYEGALALDPAAASVRRALQRLPAAEPDDSRNL